jgi:cysteine-rich repeat protein
MYRVNLKHGNRTRRYDIRAIAVIAMLMAAAMSSSCLFGTATNLCEQSGRRCSPGQTCAANQDICIDIGGCGDGIISRDKGEVCDDGNTLPGDGCSADCKSDETCGNGKKDTNETCDDGNTTAGDGCSATCKEETCGDSIYEPANGEECDTGTDTKACNGGGKCTVPECGDGYTNTAFTPFMATAPEQCDEITTDTTTTPPTVMSTDTEACNGNHDGLDGPGSCRLAFCGDGYLNKKFKPSGSIQPEGCDEGGDTQACNGDGNGVSTNRNDSKCQPAKCGDGYVNSKFKPTGSAFLEACDEGGDTQTCNGDGNGDLNNNSNRKCQTPACGDGYTNTNFKPDGKAVETCDNQGGVDTPSCNGNARGSNGPGSCRAPACGDGYVNQFFVPSGTNQGEQCDKGNAAQGILPVPCIDTMKTCDSHCNC